MNNRICRDPLSRVGTALDAANVRRAFRKVVKKAGLDSTAWTPRELRHSFVAMLSNSGVSIGWSGPLTLRGGRSAPGYDALQL
jgi:integrase